MKHIKRCYGCGEIIWPWQSIIKTEKVGLVHNNRGCILDAWYKLPWEMIDSLLLEATDALLGVKE